MSPDYIPPPPWDPLSSHFFKTYRREEMIKATTFYEKFCMSVPEVVEMPMPLFQKRFAGTLREGLLVCRPAQAFTMSFYSFLLSMLLSVFMITMLPSNSIITGVAVISPFIIVGSYYLYPLLKIRTDRMAVIGEAPLAILYLVISLRVAPSLEKAMAYASKNVPDPVGREFKFLVWDVEMRKVTSMQEAMLSYSARIKNWAPGYSDALYLVASSVTEPTNRQRIIVLEKAMSMALDNTRSIMENFGRGLGLPVAITNALAILLPILGLVLAPLASIFMERPGALSAMLVIFYDFFLPLMLTLVILMILAGRPATFSDVDISGDPDLPKDGYYRIKGVGDVPISLACVLVFILISFMTFNIGVSTGWVIFMPNPASIPGAPTGFDALTTLPLIAATGISIGLYFYLNNAQKVKARARVLEMEREFSSTLFQLGNVLEQGKPMEEAFGMVAHGLRGTHSAEFFNATVHNVRAMGMPLRSAIFDPKHGSIHASSSSLMNNVLGVVVEAADSGPLVASQTTLAISNYIENIKTVQERITDTLTDSVTAMKFQALLLVPLISAVIVGLTQVVSNILLSMSRQVAGMFNTGGGTAAISMLMSSSLFNVGNVMQGSFLQVVVGSYTVILLGLLGFFIAGLAYGSRDTIAIQMNIGKTMLIGTLIYSVIVVIIVSVFSGLLKGLVGGVA